VYDTSTGLIEYSVFVQNSDRLENIVRDGQGCVLGVHDGLCYRVNVTTGEVEDYRPPQPSPNHAWDEDTKRWVYVKTDADVAAEVRQKRAELFANGDAVIMRALRRGEPIPVEWAQYQQDLADLTAQPGFPREVIWPEAPK
jgi:hypothetical protein